MQICNPSYFLDTYSLHTICLLPSFPLKVMSPEVLLQFLLGCLSYSLAHNSVAPVNHKSVIFFGVDMPLRLPLSSSASSLGPQSSEMEATLPGGPQTDQNIVNEFHFVLPFWGLEVEFEMLSLNHTVLHTGGPRAKAEYQHDIFPTIACSGFLIGDHDTCLLWS